MEFPLLTIHFGVPSFKEPPIFISVSCCQNGAPFGIGCGDRTRISRSINSFRCSSSSPLDCWRCACKEVAGGLAIDGRIDQTIVKTIAGTIASLMRPNMVFWLVVSTPLRNIIYSHLGLWFPIYGKIKNVPNHQTNPNSGTSIVCWTHGSSS